MCLPSQGLAICNIGVKSKQSQGSRLPARKSMSFNYSRTFPNGCNQVLGGWKLNDGGIQGVVKLFKGEGLQGGYLCLLAFYLFMHHFLIVFLQDFKQLH